MDCNFNFQLLSLYRSMKRNDDNTGGIIKIPDVSAVTASVAQQQLQQSVFVQRQPTTHIEMSSRPSVTSVGGSQISLPRAHPGGPAPGTTGVTVYRSDGGAVSNPPAAHSGGIAVTTTPSSAASSQQPPAAHIGGPSGMNQPPTNLKAEQISKSSFQKFREIVMGKAFTLSRNWYFVTIIVLTYCEKKLF